MKTLLWVDDLRDPFKDDWLNFSPIGKNCKVIWVKSYKEAIKFLKQSWPDAICLDHDLGCNKTGYDIAKYIVDQCIFKNFPLPYYNSQSSNLIGKENIMSLFDNYKSTNWGTELWFY